MFLSGGEVGPAHSQSQQISRHQSTIMKPILSDIGKESKRIYRRSHGGPKHVSYMAIPAWASNGRGRMLRGRKGGAVI